ncbi:MAG: PLP-dependent aminotransferase family protein [Candidatus Rokubacteria bacterium]|nr:PLP-dependent aminotransferase family protein [Candidatus Rokubacteria bacterium]
MLLRLDGDGALGQRIYGALRRAILAGELRPASRLPATRTLARELGVSRNTVLGAYDQLLAEGYASGRRGSGTYVATALPDPLLRPAPRPAQRVGVRVPRLSAYGRRVARASAIPPLGGAEPSLRWDFRYGIPAVADVAQGAWRRVLARRARIASLPTMTYGPPEGSPALREALADYLRRARGLACDPGQIVIVNGSQQAIDLAARVLLDAGDRVAIEEPQYQGARRIFLAAGARLDLVRVDGEGFDVARVPARGVRLAYVTPSHQFPTGVVMSLGRRLALLEWAWRAGAIVLEDDYDSEFRYEGRPIEALAALDGAARVVYAGTLSKVLFPALRIGYVVLPQPLVAAFRAAKWLTDRHTPTLEQEALAAFIAEGHFERHLRRSRTRHAERRAAVLEALRVHLGDGVDVVGANAGVHVLAWLRHVAAAGLPRLVARAAEAGVGVYPVAPYYSRPPARAGLLLGYASLTDRQIHEGIRRLAEVVRARLTG